MAEATKTGVQKHSVFGDLRYFGFDSVVFANNGDTFTTPLRHIYEINLTPTTNTAVGFTVSGGVVTLVSAGGITCRGGVIGI